MTQVIVCFIVALSWKATAVGCKYVMRTRLSQNLGNEPVEKVFPRLFVFIWNFLCPCAGSHFVRRHQQKLIPWMCSACELGWMEMMIKIPKMEIQPLNYFGELVLLISSGNKLVIYLYSACWAKFQPGGRVTLWGSSKKGPMSHQLYRLLCCVFQR